MDMVVNWVRELFIKNSLSNGSSIISKELLFLKDEKNSTPCLSKFFTMQLYGF